MFRSAKQSGLLDYFGGAPTRTIRQGDNQGDNDEDIIMQEGYDGENHDDNHAVGAIMRGIIMTCQDNQEHFHVRTIKITIMLGQ